MGIFPRSSIDEKIAETKCIDDTHYRHLVRSLNRGQMEFFYHVLHSVKVSDMPLTTFLSGGAGIGKSWLVNALYYAITKHLNSIAGENPDEVKVIKVAPTEKAAYNIGGNTTHSALQIPGNRGFSYCALDSDRLNTVRTKLQKLKLIIIDEISVVGSGMFKFLNLRLQQIMGTKEPFGNISVVAVGDLFQLQPVFDKWIFENVDEGYGPLCTNL